VRLCVLASGSGTILGAMLSAGIPVDALIVDRNCDAIGLAEAAGVPVDLVERTDFSAGFDRSAYSLRVADALASRSIELAAMAGFGTVLAEPVHDALPGRIINTHPALLPSFPGWHAVRDAIAHGVLVTGCTVHVATVEVDHGPILAQEAVEVLASDDQASLHERIKAVERRIYPKTLQAILDDPEVLEHATRRWRPISAADL